MPSARGWDEPETPSLAERFVQQRKQTLDRTGDVDEPAPVDQDDTHEYDEL